MLRIYSHAGGADLLPAHLFDGLVSYFPRGETHSSVPAPGAPTVAECSGTPMFALGPAEAGAGALRICGRVGLSHHSVLNPAPTPVDATLELDELDDGAEKMVPLRDGAELVFHTARVGDTIVVPYYRVDVPVAELHNFLAPDAAAAQRALSAKAYALRDEVDGLRPALEHVGAVVPAWAASDDEGDGGEVVRVGAPLHDLVPLDYIGAVGRGRSMRFARRGARSLSAGAKKAKAGVKKAGTKARTTKAGKALKARTTKVKKAVTKKFTKSKTPKPSKTVKGTKPAKPVKPAKASKSPKPAKTDKAGKTPKTDKPAKTDKAGKTPKTDKPAKTDKAGKTPKTDKAGKKPKTAKTDKAGKKPKTDKAAKAKDAKKPKPAKEPKAAGGGGAGISAPPSGGGGGGAAAPPPARAEPSAAAPAAGGAPAEPMMGGGGMMGPYMGPGDVYGETRQPGLGDVYDETRQQPGALAPSATRPPVYVISRPGGAAPVVAGGQPGYIVPAGTPSRKALPVVEAQTETASLSPAMIRVPGRGDLVEGFTRTRPDGTKVVYVPAGDGKFDEYLQAPQMSAAMIEAVGARMCPDGGACVAHIGGDRYRITVSNGRVYCDSESESSDSSDVRRLATLLATLNIEHADHSERKKEKKDKKKKDKKKKDADGDARTATSAAAEPVWPRAYVSDSAPDTAGSDSGRSATAAAAGAAASVKFGSESDSESDRSSDSDSDRSSDSESDSDSDRSSDSESDSDSDRSSDSESSSDHVAVDKPRATTHLTVVLGPRAANAVHHASGRHGEYPSWGRWVADLVAHALHML